MNADQFTRWRQTGWEGEMQCGAARVGMAFEAAVVFSPGPLELFPDRGDARAHHQSAQGMEPVDLVFERRDFLPQAYIQTA